MNSRVLMPTMGSETTHPREGTETVRKRIKIWIQKKQLIPARGRKQTHVLHNPKFHTETTHPREGTETMSSNFPIGLTGETTHPREGTETRRAQNGPELALKQLIPARGRKHQIIQPGHALRVKQLIPARGRKLDRKIPQNHLPRNNSSPRGDGNSLNPSTRPETLETTHPREGTETQ